MLEEGVLGEETPLDDKRKEKAPGEGMPVDDALEERKKRLAGKKERYHLLDVIRGFTLVNMVLFHALYDLVFIFGIRIGWFTGTPGYIWQQYICYSFILLAGMSFTLSHNNLRRGILVFSMGLILTAVTYVFMPRETVRFGVLSLLGAAMLLFIPLRPLLLKGKPRRGLAASLLLFFLTRGVPKGYLGFEGIRVLTLPRSLYAHRQLAFLGFPSPDFVSSDYFPLIPWIFLFAAGYYLMRILLERGGAKAQKGLMLKLPGLEILGRHSLWIYMLHQPCIMLILTLGIK